MKSYTRRAFLKLCAIALPAFALLSKIPIPKPFNRTFYVHSKKGRDYFSGTTPRAPFQTIQHAVNECRPYRGDTIYLLADQYFISKPIIFDKPDVHLIRI